jgi:hypothetical protein
MIFQERDAKVLQWINGFGFASAEQIQRFMKVKPTAAYVRLKKLVDNGFLVRERILHGQARIHKITKKGMLASADALAPTKFITLGTFRHDFMLVDLALSLETETGGTFIPDRRIRHNEGLSGKGQSGHVADGYLYVGDDKPIAIELELSVKSRARIVDIINTYGGDLDVKEVWYYTDHKAVVHALEKAAKGYSFIKIRQMPEKVAA